MRPDFVRVLLSLIYNLASIANVYIKSVGIAFLLIAQVAMGSAAFQRGYPVDLSISHNFSAMGSHNATPLLESSSAKAGSLHLDDILNSATASLKPSTSKYTESKTSFLSGSIAAMTAISLLLSTSEARSGLRRFASAIAEEVDEAQNSETPLSPRKEPFQRVIRSIGVKPPRELVFPVKKKKQGPRVRFGECHIRELEREAGGGCAIVSHGVPLGLGWGILKEHSCTVDEFQEERIASGRKQKDVYCMFGRVTANIREKWLLQAGVTESTLQESAEESAYIQWGRQESNEEPTSECEEDEPEWEW